MLVRDGLLLSPQNCAAATKDADVGGLEIRRIFKKMGPEDLDEDELEPYGITLEEYSMKFEGVLDINECFV